MNLENSDKIFIQKENIETHGHKNIIIPTSYNEVKAKFELFLKHDPDVFYDVHQQFGLNYNYETQTRAMLNQSTRVDDYPYSNYSADTYENAFLARDIAYALVNVQPTKFKQNYYRYRLFKRKRLKYMWGTSVGLGAMIMTTFYFTNLMKIGFITLSGSILEPIDKVFFNQRKTMYMDTRYPNSLQTAYDTLKTKNMQPYKMPTSKFDIDKKRFIKMDPSYVKERIQTLRFIIDKHWNAQIYPSRYAWQTRASRAYTFFKDKVWGFIFDKDYYFDKRMMALKESTVTRLDLFMGRKMMNWQRLNVFREIFIKTPGYWMSLPTLILIGPILYAIDVFVPLSLALLRDDATPGEAYAVTGFVFISVWSFLWRVKFSKTFTFANALSLGVAYYGFAFFFNGLFLKRNLTPITYPWDPDFKLSKDSRLFFNFILIQRYDEDQRKD
eukprot:TRINITY_DN5209_c0_g1_i2.p1 TRINITY_DN5209_c0_g1~~TRINITY_DN5209_c0_g1_i2.p1  ORF type:complete len:457 (-),score=87.66 TRINITY_DN5209_c0_g1_i2:340-1662(-)